jgi:hypothetical protein
VPLIDPLNRGPKQLIALQLIWAPAWGITGPPPTKYPAAAAEALDCGAQAAFPLTDGRPFHCSRPKHVSMPHVAHGRTGEPIAAWIEQGLDATGRR